MLKNKNLLLIIITSRHFKTKLLTSQSHIIYLHIYIDFFKKYLTILLIKKTKKYQALIW